MNQHIIIPTAEDDWRFDTQLGWLSDGQGKKTALNGSPDKEWRVLVLNPANVSDSEWSTFNIPKGAAVWWHKGGQELVNLTYKELRDAWENGPGKCISNAKEIEVFPYSVKGAIAKTPWCDTIEGVRQKLDAPGCLTDKIDDLDRHINAAQQFVEEFLKAEQHVRTVHREALAPLAVDLANFRNEIFPDTIEGKQGPTAKAGDLKDSADWRASEANYRAAVERLKERDRFLNGFLGRDDVSASVAKTFRKVEEAREKLFEAGTLDHCKEFLCSYDGLCRLLFPEAYRAAEKLSDS